MYSESIRGNLEGVVTTITYVIMLNYSLNDESDFLGGTSNLLHTGRLFEHLWE